MRRLASDESGFTLIEVLVASVLMIVVLGATLTTFESFGSNSETNSRVSDAQDEARRSIDQLARELRNLASPTNEQPQAVKRAGPQDLIVQSVATVRPTGSLNTRNTQYVRYCYDAAQRRIYRQRLTWTGAADPPYPTGSGCPAAGWGASEIVANNVVNDARPVFTYNSATLTNVSEIHTNLWVDVNPGRRPRETAIQTTVFLRNQNRVPIARFSAAPTAGGILLNGSESEDPEERALRYFWYDPAVSTTVPRGEGIVWEYPVAPGSRTVYLVVKDPADLANEAPSQTVCVPGAGATC